MSKDEQESEINTQKQQLDYIFKLLKQTEIEENMNNNNFEKNNGNLNSNAEKSNSNKSQSNSTSNFNENNEEEMKTLLESQLRLYGLH